MKVELKAFKFFPSLSEETNCFQATVYIDGKKAGTCENRGQGGMTDLHITDGSLALKFKEWAKAQPAVKSAHLEIGDLPMSDDFMIDLLVDAMIEEQEKKKEAKRLAKIKADMLKKGFELTFQILQGDFYVCVGARQNNRTIVEIKHDLAAKYKVTLENVILL